MEPDHDDNWTDLAGIVDWNCIHNFAGGQNDEKPKRPDLVE